MRFELFEQSLEVIRMPNVIGIEHSNEVASRQRQCSVQCWGSTKVFVMLIELATGIELILQLLNAAIRTAVV